MSKLSFKLLFLVQIFQLFFAMSLIFAPVPASAADAQFVPEVPIPGANIEMEKSTKPIADYIQAIYKYAIGAVGIVSAVVLMIGGLIWLTAGGSSERISDAKSWIGSSLMGLIIAILAYSILNTINPALVNFKVKTIQNVEGAGCCEPKASSKADCIPSTTEENCKKINGTWKKGTFICSASKKCIANTSDNIITENFNTCTSKGGKQAWGVAITDKATNDTKCESICQTFFWHMDIKSGFYNNNADYCCYCKQCIADEMPCSKSGAKYDGYCMNNQCLACRTTGVGCDGWFSYNYECCNGDCLDAPGAGTGDVCN